MSENKRNMENKIYKPSILPERSGFNVIYMHNLFDSNLINMLIILLILSKHLNGF